MRTTERSSSVVHSSEHEHARLLHTLSWSWTVLLPSDTHRKPIASITAVLLPLVTYLLTLPRTCSPRNRLLIFSSFFKKRLNATLSASQTNYPEAPQSGSHVFQLLYLDAYLCSSETSAPLYHTIRCNSQEDCNTVIHQSCKPQNSFVTKFNPYPCKFVRRPEAILLQVLD
jgi:hypothetical protein